MFTLSDRRIVELRHTLLGWFARVQRPMPWRQKRSIYGTWIAEIMLQQTTVAVVEAYWLRFLDRFPDVESLAAADEQEVLALWSGLGYYRRARNLHRAAREIVHSGGGFPLSREGWAQLPGVGPYASGAIASQALGLRVPAVDANARRVLTRWLVDDPEGLNHLKPADIERHAQALVPEDDPGIWNQAVMELGALICQARKAACPECPALPLCRSGLAGTTDQVPAPAVPKETVPATVGLLVIRRGQQSFLVKPGSEPYLAFAGSPLAVRSDVTGLHQGLWGLPATVWLQPNSVKDDSLPRLIGEIGQCLAPGAGQADRSISPPVREVGRFRHSITRFRLEVRVYLMCMSEYATPSKASQVIADDHDSDYPGVEGISLISSDLTLPGGFTSHPLEHPISNLARKALIMVDDNFC